MEYNDKKNDFEWNPSDFEKTDVNTLKMAEFLTKNQMIKNIRMEDGKIKFNYPKGICSLENKTTFIDNLGYFENSKVEGIVTFTINGCNKINKICSNKKCNYKSCPLMVATYLTYLEYNSCELKTNLMKNLDYLESKTIEKINKIATTEAIKNELMELLSILKYVKLNKDNNKKLPNPTINYCFLGNKDALQDRTLSLIREMFYDFGYFNDTKYRVIDLKTNSFDLEMSKSRVNVITNLSYLNTSVEGNNQEADKKRNLQDKFLKTLMYDYKDYVIIIDDNTNEINKFLDSDTKLRSVFTKKLIFPDLTPEQIYEEFLLLCKKYNYKVSEDFREEFIEYTFSTLRQAPYKNAEYATYLFRQMSMNQMLSENEELKKENLLTSEHFPKITSTKITLEKALKNIVGLKDVKEQLYEMRTYLKYNKKISTLGIKQPKLNLHMILNGEPGTGKTTVARIIAKLLFDLGYISQNKCIEVERKDLVAKFTGQSAPKTSKVIEKAMGGVLFIDEAYSLVSDDSFAPEVIATLVKAMEDYKDDLVIIFAGYKKEMEDFMEMNSGLSSRIGYTFDFDNYNEEELLEILKLKMTDLGYKIDESSIEPCRKVIKEVIKVEDFGNGRFVDNFIQKILIKHASNNVDIEDREILTTIIDKDIPTNIDNVLGFKKPVKQIGLKNKRG